MATRIERLLEDAIFYADQLDRIGTALVDLIRGRSRYRHLLEETAEAYQLIVVDLVEIFNLVKREYRKRSLGTQGSGTSLEALERFFILYRDAAEAAEARARKVSQIRTKEARKTSAMAETLTSLAEHAAKLLVMEAESQGKWTVEWERELGLRRWLR